MVAIHWFLRGNFNVFIHDIDIRVYFHNVNNITRASNNFCSFMD